MKDRQLVYQAREAVYTLFQRLYHNAPDAEFLDWLVTEHPFSEFPITLDDEADAALQQVRSAIQSTSLDKLQSDFRQLYIGPGRMSVPPWESVYRNEDHILFDKHTLQVREAYTRHGMEFVNKNKTPEDYIAIELEFMNVLTKRLLKALEAGDEEVEQVLLNEQEAFLNQHLLIWIPRFAALTQKRAQTEFYAGLAGVLNGFLAWEKRIVSKLQASLVKDMEQ
jgi:TorA maturation chaperone TorD